MEIQNKCIIFKDLLGEKWETDYLKKKTLHITSDNDDWCFWTVVLKKTLKSPLDCKEIQPVTAKENQSWIFVRRTDVEAKAPILWPPDAKNWLIGKDPDAGKDWRQKEKETTDDEMPGWHHWLDRYEFEQAPGVGSTTRKPVVLQSIGSQRVRHDWVTELNWMIIVMKLLKKKKAASPGTKDFGV